MHELGIKALTAETISINSCPSFEGKAFSPVLHNPTYKPAYSDKYCSCVISAFIPSLSRKKISQLSNLLLQPLVWYLAVPVSTSLSSELSVAAFSVVEGSQKVKRQ